MLPTQASLNRALLHVVNEAMVHAVTAHSFLTRNRMSHLFGTCGRGTLRVVDRPEFPRNEFFEPGRVFPCRLRHAAATFDDDAWLLVRSASIKLADTDYDAPLDIEMNTGQTALFSNTVQFVDFGRLSTGERIQRDGWYYRKYPLAWEGVKTGVRRTPRSYSLLHYYTQTCSRFVGLDGVERYMKLRLLPESREPDHGFPTAWDFARPINQHRLPDETRSPTFLRDEWEARVAREGARYWLQIQLREARPDDDDAVFDACREWDARLCPWVDLAHVSIDEIIPYAEANRIRFSLGHQPPSLGLLPAKSIWDHNSLNQMRALAARAKAARLRSYEIFGEPAEDGGRSATRFVR
jgi:hypothetical protein